MQDVEIVNVFGTPILYISVCFFAEGHDNKASAKMNGYCLMSSLRCTKTTKYYTHVLSAVV